MSDDMFESDSREDVQLRSDEINGKQHIFHSLPKEFLSWHTLHYLNDKEGNVDPNSTPESMINANMWKALFNATIYGLSIFIYSLTYIYFLRSTNNILLESIYTIILVSIIFYQATQFSWYAKIRAQGIGESSIRHGKSIYSSFYTSSIAIYFSLVAATLFVYFFGLDILKIIFTLLISWQSIVSVQHITPDTVDLMLWSFGVDFHNILAALLYENQGTFKSVPFILSIIFVFYSISAFLFEYFAYKSHRKNIIKSIREYLFSSGYPIEKAQKTIQEWREK